MPQMSVSPAANSKVSLEIYIFGAPLAFPKGNRLRTNSDHMVENLGALRLKVFHIFCRVNERKIFFLCFFFSFFFYSVTSRDCHVTCPVTSEMGTNSDIFTR